MPPLWAVDLPLISTTGTGAAAGVQRFVVPGATDTAAITAALAEAASPAARRHRAGAGLDPDHARVAFWRPLTSF